MSLLKYGFKLLGASSSTESNTPSAPASAIEDEIDTSSLPSINNSESDSDVPKPSKRKKINPARKYDPSYLSFGFIFVGPKELPRPLCVVCKGTFANSAMKPSHLERHLKKMHPDVMDKPIDYFERLKNETKCEGKNMEHYTQLELASIESSFAVAYEIAKAKKPFASGEQLVQPCLSKVVEIMLGSSALAKINSVPLSRNTIARRVSDMARDVESQLSSRLKEAGNFALQFDESTDIVGEAILIGFVRYTHDGKIREDIFCFCSLPERTTANEIFNAIDNKMQQYELDWANVIGLCTDGAAAMTGSKNGLAQRISEVAHTDFVPSHCIIHREALASKDMSTELNGTLVLAVKMINNIKANALNSRMFSLICSEMTSDHKTLLLHAKVRWLSRGKVLTRLFELRSELCAYFKKYIETKVRKQKNKKDKKLEKSSEEIFLEKVNDNEWLSMLAYLADIFGLLNELNLQLQGRGMNFLVFWNKIDAFKKKLSIWKQQIMQSNFTPFSLINDLLSENASLVKFIKPIIVDHLERLILKFEVYFSARNDPRASHLWVVNPFLNMNESNSLTEIEKYQLLGNFMNIPLSSQISNLKLHYYFYLFHFSRFHRIGRRSNYEEFI